MRALRRSQHWQPFRAGLCEWLERWHPQRSTLALIGPSGGYCLPLAALHGFERLVVFEVDPVARFILRRRLTRALPGLPVQWIGEDRWIAPLLHGHDLPRDLLGEDTALLFTNILGQVPYLFDDQKYPAWRRVWRKRLFPWLQHTPWASFHDRVSSDVAPYEALPRHGPRLNAAEVGALYESDPTHQRIELSEHGTHELLPAGYDYTYLHWPMTRSRHHLIECVLGGPHGR